MIIPCRAIQKSIENTLAQSVLELKNSNRVPTLLAVLVGDDVAQHSYVRMKRKIAERIGVNFEFWHVPDPPAFDTFLELLQQKIHTVSPVGIIVQLPLPPHYNREKLYEVIGVERDIEGHHPKNQYVFPLVQACMVGLMWARTHLTQGGDNIKAFNQSSFPITPSTSDWQWLHSKNIVIAGRGMTTGAPIARYFETHQLPYVQTHSKMADADGMYKQADIIISGVGKRILHRGNIKPGVILLNFGLHQDVKSKKLTGDYDEDDVHDVAALYTQTPGGLGPLDIACLYGNLIHAARQAR
ncbi:MAG TPA: bifunctional 5,10-methylenetetrahydrofolate dehydrogenase/5,10-methenyltetrahydrofolate cyclohydrolase [Candidatus Woesebacteria bacterium]|nr:bifunctional 5,10-methylenetetrahydrofolate dehydrogenase/5,10-methenyltetrahydrofolate cyclohydrolase [Candidatus Woesebacteria bacterium]HNS94355.1 bifunctional 5,10-methylenetetrahydrofolate dehydrogenase/5,10-methenyltetrahydrofolate cyclohydrolase [Candidatus Woesebacteria bacterium]